jgi:hypothetical protein
MKIQLDKMEGKILGIEVVDESFYLSLTTRKVSVVKRKCPMLCMATIFLIWHCIEINW